MDPLRALAGGVTPSSSPHNSATSNTHPSDCWSVNTEAKDDSNILYRDRHLSDRHMKRVCLVPPSLDETSDKWPIDHDVA